MDPSELAFISFWASLRDGAGPDHFHQILDGLSDALDRVLNIRAARLYTPPYLAYKAMTFSATYSLNFRVLIQYSAVRNTPFSRLRPVNIPEMRAWIAAGRNGKQLLLDILADGRTWANRDQLDGLLEMPAARPRNIVALGRGPQEIRLPLVINIEKDFKQYLPFLQDLWQVVLSLDMKNRIVTVIPRINAFDFGEDVDTELFHSTNVVESRYYFLAYVKECLRHRISLNFLHFYRGAQAEFLREKCKVCDWIVEVLNSEFPDNRALWVGGMGGGSQPL